MEVDSPPPPSESPPRRPRGRIVQRLEGLGVPKELLDQSQRGLVAFVKNNKQWIPELVSAMFPPDEEVAEFLNETKPGSKKPLTMKNRFRESVWWLQWLMFEGEPSAALMHLSKMSLGQRGVCGAVWGQNDLVYKCRTCENDPRCAICVPCFQNGNHKDHDYSVIYSPGGGCCDCGDVTAWKRKGFCSNHKGAEQIRPLPQEFANTMGPVLDCVFGFWKNKLLLAEIICRENPKANGHVAERKVANELTFGVVEMLLEFCKYSESLLSFVSKMVLSSVDLLGILVRAERFLNETLVKKLHELLLKLLGEPLFKYEFAKVFLSYYPIVVSEARKELSENFFKNFPLLSLFSAQIFTVPTLTLRLVKEMNLLSMLMGCWEDIFSSCAGDDGRLQVKKWSNLWEITIHVIRDIQFVMSHAIVRKYVTHDQQDFLRTWMRLLAFVQGMNPQKRETGLHIEEENDSMYPPFFLGRSIANIHSLLVDWAFFVASDKMDEDFQDVIDRDSLRHGIAKVGWLSQESSACSAVGTISSFACASNVSEDKPDALSDLLIPPSVMWLTYECLRAIENWLGVDNTSGALLDSSPSTSNSCGGNFSALKRTLAKIRKGKYIFSRLASSREDHGKQCSSHLHSDCNMSVDFQNDKISGQESKLMVTDEIDSVNACSPAGLDDRAMEVDGAVDLDTLRVLGLSDWSDMTYDVSSQDLSVHIPLHRLLSLLLQKALRRCFGEVPALGSATTANSSSAIFTDFFGIIVGGCHPYGFSSFIMEHPLRIRVFCAEVHAGMWRKNGDAAPLSCECYRSVCWSEQDLELDLFLLQCCAVVAPADHYVNRIVKRFGLSSYLSLNLERSSEYETVLVQEMLTLFIQIVSERRFCGLTKAESLKRELVHKLAIADVTHSQLVKSLPRDLSKFDQLPEILDTIAAYSNPSGFKQGTYSLQWTFWKELDLYYPRWNSRDLQSAEERYLRFRSISALTTQLPRWTNIYPPFKGVARVATCKVALQIIRTVLFYAVFSDKLIDSRAPDGVLLTTLHLLSLALDICFQHKESGDQSCYDGDAIPMLAFAGEEINEGLHFGAGQQSLLSLLVILMRMYKKENLDSCLEGGSCNLSSLIGSLLKQFAEIDSGCMTKLQLLAPEVIGRSQSSPNGDTYTSGSISDSEKRKAKARERQAAILAKMKAEQSKFMASVNSTVDDGSKYEQEVCNPDVEDDSEESAQVVCSLCHDPSSRNPISYLVLLQKSRLLNFMDRGPLSWEQPHWMDKEHISVNTNDMIDQSETSTVSGGSEVVSSYSLRELVQNAVTEFACHGEPRDVDAILDFLKARFHELRSIRVPCELKDEREKTSCSFETMEYNMYFSIQKAMHDKMLHSKLMEDTEISTPEGDQEKTEHAEFMLLGKYIAALSRETTENPSSSESALNEKVPVDSSRHSAFDGFGPTDCDGIYLSTCGHAVHQKCLDRYLLSLKERHLRRIVFEGGHIIDPDKGEFLCPVCRRLVNSVLPALPGLIQKVSKDPLHAGVSSSQATGPSVNSGEEINSLRLQQGLALLQSSAKASGEVGNLKVFPLQRCGRMTSDLEPISRLLCKLYFPITQDKLSGSARVSHPMLMWDTIRYSLLSMEIAARSGGKYATPSYGLNSLYKELESSSRFTLSLLLKVVQNKSKNSLHVLQRFIGTQSFAESICFGVSVDHGNESCGQGAMLRILEHVDNAVSYPDIQFWNRTSDPVLARDPFSSLMWVLFCLPYRFLSCEDSLLSLVHLFYVVSVVQGIVAYLGKNQCNITGLGVDECLVNDIFKLMEESGFPQQYFVLNYIGSSYSIKNTVRNLSFPYLRRCALLLNLLHCNAQAPFLERYNVLDRSHSINDMMDTTYKALVELNEVQEIERMFKIPTLDVILKDKVVRSIAQKWFCHFCKEFEVQRFQGSIQCNPAVPFQLMRLPRVYQDLLQRYIRQHCPACNSILDDPALCLLCGRLCSPNWKSCCRESGCQTHAVACGSGTGVFLLIKRTTILLQRSARQAPWPSPYLDAFGEEDIELIRGKPLYLNEERYAALTYLVASHGLDRSSKVLGKTTIGSLFIV